VRTYAAALVALLLLTGLTTGIAFIDLGVLNVPIALAVAAAKAVIVALFFMHLVESTRLTIAVVLGTLFWLGILVVLTMSDYLTRHVLRFG
jgi:cytochrome c oxidase subunit IV